MPDSGNRSDNGSTLGQGDAFLREVAQAPEMTLPSPRAAGEGDPERLSHFTVLGRIGQGGMGIVYRAKDEKLGRTVALKVLPREFEADETRRNRFIREARAAAAVTHPNIVTVYEIGESAGRIFIAMELVEGRTLRALMNEGPMAAPTALRLMLQITAGVAKAHEAGIVHRDLKPENTLVTSDAHVKLLDFGLAKHHAGEGVLVTGTGEGMILGTPAYMSPEQMQGRPATAAADVFALGVMLYELLTAQRPFTGKNLPQLVRSIERDVPSAPSRLNPLVPVALDGIVARCLSKDPDGRFADARALLEELRKLETAASRTALASTIEQPAASSLVTPPPSSAVVGRSRRRATVGVIALVLGIVAVGAVGQRIYRARHAAPSAPVQEDIAIVGPRPSLADEAETTPWPPPPWAPPADGRLHLWSSARHRGQARTDMSRYCGPFVDKAPNVRSLKSADELTALWLAEPTDGLPPAQVDFCRSQAALGFLTYEFGYMRTMVESRNQLAQLAKDISASATRRLALGEAPFCPSGAPVPRQIDGPLLKYQPADEDWTRDPGWNCVASSLESASFFALPPIYFQYRFETTPTTFVVSGRRFVELEKNKLWEVTMTLPGTVKDGQVLTAPDIDEKWVMVY